MKKNVVGVLVMCLLLVFIIVGCGSAEGGGSSSNSEESSTSSAGSAIADLRVGAIGSFGKDDGGWTQAQYTGLVDAFALLGIEESNLEFIENVAETGTDFANAAEGLIAGGCEVIVGASTGYKSAIEELAVQYPEVQFAQAGGEAKGDNLVGYQIRSYDGMFLNGYIAALMSENNELGYSAGQPEASVIQGINAFALGAKYANPEATVRVVWAGSWYDPTEEANCANNLISLGITALGINASSPAIPQTAQEAGVYCTGYHVDMKHYAPEAVLQSYMWNWAPIFSDIFTTYAEAGTPFSDSYYWGAEKGCSTISDINMDIVPEEIAEKTLEIKESIETGELDVLAGEIKDNEGNVIVEAGGTMPDEINMRMDFLVENIVGQLP